MTKPVIFWFRQDLRTSDLPGLEAALSTGRPVIPCYVLDETSAGEWAPGGASRWWLHHSLQALGAELAALGAKLLLRRGSAMDALQALADETGADTIFCSRHYEPWANDQEQVLHAALEQRDIVLKRYGGNLLFEPGKILNQSGLPFKVFTPFWRNCRAAPEPAQPRALPRKQRWFKGDPGSEDLANWGLCPTGPDWAREWFDMWAPGSAGARFKLRSFLADKIVHYEEGRNHPALDCTTRLSPHLHFGDISPREVWHAARQAGHRGDSNSAQVDKFLSELGWREFSHHLLHHFPHIATQPFKPQYQAFPWLGTPGKLRAWQQGQTGYPIVDAGMRELWQTGFMHNRIRMVTASFLTKHLLVPWQAGARWFWDTLLDADLANNSSGWQWVAGSGADASPYFRIFNPVTQGQKFDADGDYVRRWAPELAALPNKYLHCPWEAPAEVLVKAGVSLGGNYPAPIVDHRSAREAALAAYGSIKG